MSQVVKKLIPNIFRLSLIKRIINKIKTILPLVNSNKSRFFFKIIQGEYYVKFQPSLVNEIEYFKKKYKFNYDDWFSYNINVWKKVLNSLEEIKYLEIGSFEGRSAVFVGELDNTIEVTCVDTFQGSNEHPDINFDLVYKNCSDNLDKLNKSHNLFKNTSHNFFLNNNKKFNVIYIDGSHFFSDVKEDFINSMECLEDNGILICDDFYWLLWNKIELNPTLAILECYENFKDNLDILFINNQIVFKKKPS